MKHFYRLHRHQLLQTLFLLELQKLLLHQRELNKVVKKSLRLLLIHCQSQFLEIQYFQNHHLRHQQKV
jgi:hypothetical protein